MIETRAEVALSQAIKNAPEISARIDELLQHGQVRATNGELIRRDLIPCEVNPRTGGLSRTSDPAHALAVFTISGKGFGLRHVCRGCAMEFYSRRPIREGIHWS